MPLPDVPPDPSRDPPPVVIVGGGLTGISAAMHLRRPWLLFESERALGGLARSEERDKFFFDRTGHWLHLRDPSMLELVTTVAPDLLVRVQRRAKVYAAGVFVPYPFQANVHGLPRDVAYDCLLGYVRSLLRRGQGPGGSTPGGIAEPRNFEQYILHHFGEGIARHFMIPYNTKLWGVHPREITSAWCQRFVPVPTVEQMLAGMVGASVAELGYNVRFHYPRHGGIGALSAALAARLDPARTRLGVRVERIDPRRRTVSVGGETVRYHALISTMPLPELVRSLADPPAEVAAAGGRLRSTAVRYLNVATRTRPPEDYHWIYVPDERLPFYRVGVYSNAVPSMAPPRCASLYVELARRGAPDDRDAEVAEAVRALVEVGAVASPEDVIFADVRQIDHAYVITDEAYEDALRQITSYLEEHRIFSRGRYGSWTYNSMEDSLLAGRDAAGLADGLPPITEET